MGITVKYLEELGVEKEIAEKIFAERGKEITVDKDKREKLEKELTERQTSLENLTTEFETLKGNNSSAEEWQKKFETLRTDIADKEKKAESERAEAEKRSQIEGRFNVCIGEKKFSHEAIKGDYLKKFAEALEAEENKGKGDVDVFHALTKDDATAFSGVVPVKLPGGNPQPGAGADDAAARSIMGIK